MSALTTYIDVVSRFDERGLQEAEKKTIAMNERVKRLQATIGPAVNQQVDDKLIRQAIANSDRLAREQDRLFTARQTTHTPGIGPLGSSGNLSAAGIGLGVTYLLGKALEGAAEGQERLNKALYEGKDATKAWTMGFLESLPIIGSFAKGLDQLGEAAIVTAQYREGSRATRAQEEEFARQKQIDAEEKKRKEEDRRTGLRAEDEAGQLSYHLGASTQVDELERQRAQIQHAADRDISRMGADLEGASPENVDAIIQNQTNRQELANREKAKADLDDFFAGVDYDVDTVNKAVDDFFGGVEEKAAKAQQGVEDTIDSFWDAVEKGVARTAQRVADLRGDATEIDLRTSGKPGEAAVHRIERELTDALKDAGDNPELRAALIDNANSQLGALVAVQGGRVAGGTSAFDINQTSLGRGEDAKETNQHLTDLVREAQKTNATLKDLTATTS